MSIAKHIQASFELPNMVVRAYLEDLADEELFVRPTDNMNHIAWQLGHLIHSEHFHVNQVCPDSMPKLPDEFVAAHSKENASSDERDRFLGKADYLRLMEEQRGGTLRNLEQLSDAELSSPSPDSIKYFGATVGAVFAGETAHWMMHAGQWAVVRRKLGKAPLF